MSEIERLAIRALEIHHGAPLVYPLAATTTSFVRAVLQALREPSEAEISAIRAKYAPHFPNDPVKCMGWVDAEIENRHIMIDTLLAEPKP